MRRIFSGFILAVAAVIPLPGSAISAPVCPPATLASDTFSGGDGGLGANWTTVTTFTNPQVLSGVVVDENVGGAAALAAYTGISWGDDQWSQAVIKSGVAADSTTRTSVRSLTSTATAYIARVNGVGGSQSVLLNRLLAGTSVNLVTTTSVAVANDDILYLEVIGSTLIVKINGSAIGSPYVDATPITSTGVADSPGIGVGTGSGSITDASLDDWSAGDFSGGASFIPGIINNPIRGGGCQGPVFPLVRLR